MDIYEDYIKPFEYMAVSAADYAFGLFGGRGELRDPPVDGTVTLPDDLFAQTDVQTEWWYYTGHCEYASGRRFGFELVFFKRRTDRDRLGFVPINAIANPLHFAHFAISDIDAGSFRYEHVRSFGKPFELPVHMSDSACDIKLGPWSLREVAGKHILHATLGDGFVFDAVLESRKPVVLNGRGGSGISEKKNGASNHFSLTNMAVSGQTSTDGVVETFTGKAWMDREFGSWEQGNWDWFSIQFADDTELMIYQFRSETGEMNGASTGTFVGHDGSCEYLERDDFEIDVLSTWTSPHTGAVYPAQWRIRASRLGIDVVVEPSIADQELDTRGTTMIVYWEGACRVSGTRNGTDVTGNAYVELVGYDRSHESAGIADFLFGGAMKELRKLWN